MDKNKLWLLIGALIIVCGCMVIVGGGVAGYFLFQAQAEDIGSDVTANAPTETEQISEDADKTETEESTPAPEATEAEKDSEPVPTTTPDWEKFEGKGIELWLPESYEGGDLDQDLEIIIERLKQMGPDFEDITQMIERNPSAFILWAFDSEVGESGFLTNVNAAQERVFSSLTLDTYLDAATKQLPPQFQVVDRQIVSLDRYDEAGRLVIEMTMSGVEVKQVMYAIKKDNTMWLVVFTTGADEFDQRLPTFEQSMNSLVIQP